MVKERVIGNVDKELAGGAVFVSGTCYRALLTRVLCRPLLASSIGGLVFLLDPLGETAA
ncbi:hypothetical protein ACLB1S_27970 [Escherichia coli]